MADIKKQASKMLAEEIIRAIKKLTDDNNKQYVNPQLKNYRFTVDNFSSDVKQSISDIAKDTAVDKDTLDQAVQDAIGNVELNVSQVVGLEAKVAEITVLEVEKATIDTAQIENLYATVADIIYLAAEKAEIGDLEAEKITTAIADMGIANIGSADIGFAQIKDLVSGTAIIREGVGGKLYIDRLAVTDAQILSLTTGELVMQGTDGKLYTVYVDDEGVVQTKLRVVTGGDIANGTISGDNIANGTIFGDNIAENTITGALITEHGITARELNVSQIFADEALIGAIKAANIDVADLSANEAFVGQLITSLIKAPNFGSDLDISKNASIELTNERIGLIVTDESTKTEVVLTESMLRAISEHMQFIADVINFSANESINLIVSSTVKNEISNLDDQITQGTEPPALVEGALWLDISVSPNLLKRWDGSAWVVVNDNSDLKEDIEQIETTVTTISADLTVKEGQITALTNRLTETESDITGLTTDIDEAKATLTPDGLNAIVEKCQVIENINGDIVATNQSVAQVSVTANKIYWLIDSDSSSASAMVLTDEAAQIISKNIILTADQINAIANDIVLTGNKSVGMIVNNSVNELSEQVNSLSSEFVQRVDSIEVNLLQKVDDEELRKYMRYDNGVLELGRSDSRYTTQTSDNGFIVNLDGQPMASMMQNEISSPVISAKRMFSLGDHSILLGAHGHLIFN